MTQFIFVLVGLAFVIAMATLGTVLLARFLLGDSLPGRRMWIAATLGPASVIGPFVMVAMLEDGLAPVDALAGFAVLFVISAPAIGWPQAYFATRRLDRLTMNHAKVFE